MSALKTAVITSAWLRTASARLNFPLLYTFMVITSSNVFILSVYCNVHFKTLKGSPYVRPMGSVSAVGGRRLEIPCPVAGYPIEAITWEKGF